MPCCLAGCKLNWREPRDVLEDRKRKSGKVK